MTENNPPEMKSNSKLIYVAPLIFFIVMVVVLYTGLGKDPTQLDSQLIGKPLPKFRKTLLLSEETIFTQNDIQGPALINVFGSWCPSCYQEHPHLMKLSTQKS